MVSGQWSVVSSLTQAAVGRECDRRSVFTFLLDSVPGHFGGDRGEEVVVCRHADDAVELHCHGGFAAVARMEESLVAAGCRRPVGATGRSIPGIPVPRDRARGSVAAVPGAYIVAAVRSAIGRRNGALAETRAEGPLSQIMLASVVVADLTVIMLFSVALAITGRWNDRLARTDCRECSLDYRICSVVGRRAVQPLAGNGVAGVGEAAIASWEEPAEGSTTRSVTERIRSEPDTSPG